MAPETTCQLLCAVKWTHLETSVLPSNVLQTVSLGKDWGTMFFEVKMTSVQAVMCEAGLVTPSSLIQQALKFLDKLYWPASRKAMWKLRTLPPLALFLPKRRDKGVDSHVLWFNPWVSTVPDCLPPVSSLKALIWNLSFYKNASFSPTRLSLGSLSLCFSEKALSNKKFGDWLKKGNSITVFGLSVKVNLWFHLVRISPSLTREHWKHCFELLWSSFSLSGSDLECFPVSALYPLPEAPDP